MSDLMVQLKGGNEQSDDGYKSHQWSIYLVGTGLLMLVRSIHLFSTSTIFFLSSTSLLNYWHSIQRESFDNKRIAWSDSISLWREDSLESLRSWKPLQHSTRSTTSFVEALAHFALLEKCARPLPRWPLGQNLLKSLVIRLRWRKVKWPWMIFWNRGLSMVATHEEA